MDTSNRGKITIQELRLGLRKLGIVVPQDDIQILMDAVSYQATYLQRWFQSFEYLHNILLLL